ncbi:MAG: hypothetical protein PVI40_06570 [Chlamydiota bacterium]
MEFKYNAQNICYDSLRFKRPEINRDLAKNNVLQQFFSIRSEEKESIWEIRRLSKLKIRKLSLLF